MLSLKEVFFAHLQNVDKVVGLCDSGARKNSETKLCVRRLCLCIMKWDNLIKSVAVHSWV